MSAGLKNAAELAARLDFIGPPALLLVDAPEALVEAIAGARSPDAPELEVTEARALRSVKGTYDGILLWREERGGSQAVLESLVKQLGANGAIWVVTAMRKVSGPKTPAIHRLDRHDLEKTFGAKGLKAAGETRLSAWHVGYRYVRE